MSDYEAIQQTMADYFEGFVAKDRARLERAFATDIATMMGFMVGEDDSAELFSQPISESIDRWVNPDNSTPQFTESSILSLHIFGENAATVVFNFGGKYLDNLQLAKINGDWKIVNKFFVEQ